MCGSGGVGCEGWRGRRGDGGIGRDRRYGRDGKGRESNDAASADWFSAGVGGFASPVIVDVMGWSRGFGRVDLVLEIMLWIDDRSG